MNICLTPEQIHQSRLAEYAQVVQNFRSLADIRFKLLGFLPIGTAVSFLLAGWINRDLLPLLSLFGLIVTIALLIYNERNDQHYGDLVARAAELERAFGLPDGSFNKRPGRWLKVDLLPKMMHLNLRVTVDHSAPIATIYGASIAAWLYGILSPQLDWMVSVLKFSKSSFGPRAHFLFGVASAGMAAFIALRFIGWLGDQRNARQRNMRAEAKKAVEKLSTLPFSKPQFADHDKWQEVFVAAASLRGGQPQKELEKVLHRARFYLSAEFMQSRCNPYYPVPALKSPFVFGVGTAVHVISLLTDLPVRWLVDTFYDRSGVADAEPRITSTELWIRESGMHASSYPQN